jgi:hypothetical protein
MPQKLRSIWQRVKTACVFDNSEHSVNHRVEMYRHPKDFPDRVRELFEFAEGGNVGFGHVWYANLLDKVYPDGQGVEFYVLWEDGVPMAGLPILVARQWGGTTARSLTNFYSALYAPAMGPTATEAHLVPVLRAIRECHAPLVSFRFDPLDPESDSYRALKGALDTIGMRPFDYFCFGNWYLKADNDWATYLASRSGTLRSTIKRMNKKFGLAGGTLEIIQSDPELERGTRAYETVYAKSWKNPEPFPAFVPGLIATCAERRWLRLGIAWLGDSPIAAQLWIVCHGKASIYKVAYDENYKEYAPGTILSSHLLEHVLTKDAVTEVDYMIGDDKYKKTWMSDRRERRGLIAYNAANASGLVGLWREILGRILRRLRLRR